jgi:putative endonuclease
VTRTARQGLGATGEQIARLRLEQRGYRFIAANWRCPSGELDLVMQDDQVVVFCEVKIRRGAAMGTAEEAISPAQGKRLLTAAQLFLAKHSEHQDAFWRIDLYAITLDRSGAIARETHIADAVQSR